MDKEAMRKFVWGECLVLSAQKQTQFNKGKRSAYQGMWDELGGDITPAKREKLERESESNELLELLERAYQFIKNGPAPQLEEDLKKYCEFLSKK